MQQSREDFEAPPTNELQGENNDQNNNKNLMNSAQTAAIQGTHLDDIVQRNVIVKELNSEELLQKAHSDIIKECQRNLFL